MKREVWWVVQFKGADGIWHSTALMNRSRRYLLLFLRKHHKGPERRYFRVAREGA